MAAKKFKLSALFGMLEATFATDPSASGALYKHLFVRDATWEPKQDIIERPGLVADLVRQAHAMGAKAGTISFKMELKGSGTAAASAVVAIAAEADPILQSLFGTVTRGTGDLIQAGSTTSVLNVVDGTRFSKYMMVIVNTGAANGWQARFITSIAANALTLDRALSALPANGNAVHASSKYSRANTGHSSLAFVGKRHDIEYNFLGCKIDSAKVTGVGARGEALLDVTCSVTDWNVSAKASLPVTNLTGITAIKGPIIKGACFALGGTEEFLFGLDFDFAHKFEFQDSTCAQGTAQPDSVNAGMELVEAGPMGGIKAYYNAQHGTDFFAGNEISLAFAAFSQPGTVGNAWGIYCPKIQHVDKSFEEHAGMVGESLPFKVNDNGTDPEYVLCIA